MAETADMLAATRRSVGTFAAGAEISWLSSWNTMVARMEPCFLQVMALVPFKSLQLPKKLLLS